ncbi:MAG TPA: ParB/RepB/Spo0J family partition protein [Euzebyales bacterium]|nr:ParB/RepB/Spo0J family partition protein [Euzebyales bacterium]
MSRVGGLGRGLDALIPTATAERGGLRTILLDNVEPNPRQPREAFDQHGIAELAQSLQTVGLLQPIVVRESGNGRYQIIAGERRFRAAQLAGFREIKAVVRHTGDDQVLTEALVENIHRVDLNALEEAAAYQQLLEDFGFTHEQLAARIGKSRSTITNTLRLLTLGPELQRHVIAGTLSPGHARALLAVEDAELQRDIAEQIIADGLSVRAAEELVRKLLRRPAETKPDPAPAEDRAVYSGLQRRLSDAFATKVRIMGSEKRGQVVIDFAGRDDLQRLLGVLENGVGDGLQHESAL